MDFQRQLRRATRAIIVSLIAMMLFAVVLATLELAIILLHEMRKPPAWLLGIENLLEIFGFFLMILIGLELLESIRAYLADDTLHVEVVFLVAMIAVARKVIILEVNAYSPLALVGVASLILALALGYFFVKRAIRDAGRYECPPPEGDAGPAK
ncbi:MAG: phosphate-starvation-inducible PsiE family protein [Desulfobacterales bacterium]